MGGYVTLVCGGERVVSISGLKKGKEDGVFDAWRLLRRKKEAAKTQSLYKGTDEGERGKGGKRRGVCSGDRDEEGNARLFEQGGAGLPIFHYRIKRKHRNNVPSHKRRKRTVNSKEGKTRANGQKEVAQSVAGERNLNKGKFRSYALQVGPYVLSSRK